MRNKYILQLLIFTGFLLLNACSKQVRVGFLMDNSETGRWEKDKTIFIDHMKSLGGEVVFRSSNGDADKQLELAQEILSEDIDILVLVPTDQYKAAKIVIEAHKKNVPVISYDRLVRDCLVDFYISFDNVNVGELQADYITTTCPKGNYALIGGAKTDNNSFLLRLGQLSVIQPLIDRGDINVVYDNFAEEWNPSEGYRMMDDYLKKNNKIDAVIAANDMLAGGVVEALKAHNKLDGVCISGMDADLEACQRIFAGTQTMTVYKPIEAIAIKAAEIAYEIVKKKEIPTVENSINNGVKQVPSLLLPAMIVNKGTLDLTVVADGYLDEQNIRREKLKE